MTPCTKCGGKGLIDRVDKEELAKTSPILARHQTVCDKCSGSGSLSPEDVRLAAREAAKNASG